MHAHGTVPKHPGLAVHPSQTFYGGHLTGSACQADDATRRKTARAESEMARDLGGDDGDDAADDCHAAPTAATVHAVHTPHHPGEAWPPHLATGRGRVPSLAPRDDDERERIATAAGAQVLDVSSMRAALDSGDALQRWRWSSAAEVARHHHDPVVRLLQVAPGMLPSWQAAASGQPALYRGLSQLQLATVC